MSVTNETLISSNFDQYNDSDVNEILYTSCIHNDLLR